MLFNSIFWIHSFEIDVSRTFFLKCGHPILTNSPKLQIFTKSHVTKMNLNKISSVLPSPSVVILIFIVRLPIFTVCLMFAHTTNPQQRVNNHHRRQLVASLGAIPNRQNVGSSPSSISDILHNVISCMWHNNFKIPAGHSCCCFGGWDFSPPIQRCSLSQKTASKLKKTSFFEYTFLFCILILSKNEYTTFFKKFQFDFIVAFGSVQHASEILISIQIQHQENGFFS